MPVAATPATQPSATVRTNLSYLVPICLVATLGGLLFGYDTGVISGAIEFLTARFHLDVVMKGWASGCVLIGCATGVLIVGPISDRFGRKKALLLAALLFLASAIGTALPRDIWTFILFRWLGGIGIGIASMSTPMYIAEIAPAHLRGRLVSVNQIAIVGGILVVYFVNYFIARYGDQAWNEAVGWRWMFASGTLPSIAFALLLFGIPESPRWLVEMGRAEEAKTILAKVAGEDFAAAELASIRAALSAERGNWAELFSRALRLPLVVGILLAILQQVTGINVFLYFGTTIFKNMSASTGVDAGMLQQIIIGGASALSTVVAIASVDKWGRRPLMFLGAGRHGHQPAGHGHHGPEHRGPEHGERLDAPVHHHLRGLLRALRRSGDLGHPVRDLPHCRSRARPGTGHVLPVDGRLRRHADLPDDGRKGLVVRAALQPRLPVLHLRGVLPGADPGGLVPVPETKGRSLEEIERSWRPSKIGSPKC